MQTDCRQTADGLQTNCRRTADKLQTALHSDLSREHGMGAVWQPGSLLSHRYLHVSMPTMLSNNAHHAAVTPTSIHHPATPLSRHHSRVGVGTGRGAALTRGPMESMDSNGR